MKYEKDLEYLRRELKNAQNIYDEAEEDECESDAEMWMNRITHLEFQIDVFKNAAKADEYEVKAKAFDDIREARKEVLTDVRARGLKLPADLDKFSLMTERIINEYERGESE